MTDDEFIRNEQLRLTATFCNTIAASCVTVAVLTPLVALVVNPAGLLASDDKWNVASAVMLAGIGAGSYLHLLARRFLGNLTP